MDTSASIVGNRERTPVDAMDTGYVTSGNLEKRPRRPDIEMALAAYLEVAKGHAQWRNPEPKPQVDADRSSVAEGADGAMSERVAGGSKRVFGRKLSPDEEEQHAELPQAAKTKELENWKKFDVFDPR